MANPSMARDVVAWVWTTKRGPVTGVKAAMAVVPHVSTKLGQFNHAGAGE